MVSASASGGYCPDLTGLCTTHGSSTPQLGNAYPYAASVGKPILVSAGAMQYFHLPPSQSLPQLTKGSKELGGDAGIADPTGGAGGGGGSPVDALRAELVDLRRREQAYLSELQRLQALLDSASADLATRSGGQGGPLAGAAQLEAAVEKRTQQWEGELTRVRAESKAKLDESQKHVARLEAKLVALRGAAEGQAAALAAKEREGRVELLYRRTSRRMLHHDLARGWAAWESLWQARSHALWWMREARNRLQRPGLAVAFEAWVENHQAGKAAREIAAHVRHEAGLQGEASALERHTQRLRRQANGRRGHAGGQVPDAQHTVARDARNECAIRGQGDRARQCIIPDEHRARDAVTSPFARLKRCMICGVCAPR